MELKESKRVCDEIEKRLNAAISKSHPLAASMVPEPVKQTIRDALAGAYASGFNHGYQEGEKQSGASK